MDSIWLGRGGRLGKMVLTGSLGLWPLAGRPPTKSVCGRGPCCPWCCRPGPSWLWAQTPSVTSWIRLFSQRMDTWGWGEVHQGGSSQMPPDPLPRVPSPSPSPYATGQCVNAGGSGLGAGAQGLRSELQSVCGSGREAGRGCWLSGGQRGAGTLGGRVGGRAWRAVTWKPSKGVSLVPYLHPTVAPPTLVPTQAYQSLGEAGTCANSR